ncbi:band 7 [Chlorella sorokiniana]|uniref:Band 7 n=1 Tax=Chlorella sorokiniana TaxID=3076 RepID=A0A2P6TCW0_CHLSO|nr:band 7 [Chlorella sorokiniana]|eukprot:PRW20475.1 band 7 [Chlorella sorokiniana]
MRVSNWATVSLQLLLIASAAVRLAEAQSVEATALQTGAPAAAGQLVSSAAAAIPRPSPYFGYVGELWRPDGPLPDFSYAGYKFGDQEPPAAAQTPVTKWLADFLQPGVTQSQAILNLVAWGNAQPAAAGWVVLGLPPGVLTLERQVVITRPYTILRGAGRDQTSLFLPNSMTDLYGKCNTTGEGFWVWTGGLVTAKGPQQRPARLAAVDATIPVPRGSYALKVDSAAKLAVGQIVALHYKGGNYALAREIMNNHLDPGNKYAKNDAMFVSRIRSISGQIVTLERAVPWSVKPVFEPELVTWQAGLHHVGIEGFTMHFRHTPYGGHHKELGMGGVEFSNVEDCWARDLRVINSDNGVMVAFSDRVTVSTVEVAVTMPRLGPPEGPRKFQYDGHWGARVGNSRDILFRDISIQAHMVHAMGADGRAIMSVFEASQARIGTVEMHRAQSAMELFTDINVGDPAHSFYNGGPETSGPNAGAFTTYWNIRSNTGSHAPPDHSHNKGGEGDCSFGPDLNFIGVTFTGPICPTWVYQPGAVTPPNLYLAQLGRRRQLSGASRLHSQTLETDAPASAPAAADAAAPAAADAAVLSEFGEGHRRPPLLEESSAVEPSSAPDLVIQSLPGLEQAAAGYDPDLLSQLVEEQPAAAAPAPAADPPQRR